MLRWRIDPLGALKSRGYSAYRLRKERIFGQNTIQALREGQGIMPTVIDRLCGLLGLQPGDLIEYVPDKD